MTLSPIDAAVIGGGAAGVAAARRLHQAGLSTLILEARDRLGGRGHTVQTEAGPVDLGCGWLHSGDVNPWTDITGERGFTVDRTPPPWGVEREEPGFPIAEQQEFGDASDRFYTQLAVAAGRPEDAPASTLLEAGSRWNGLLHAVSTWINGVELEGVSIEDLHAYADTEVNWRVAEGYGALIARHGEGLPVSLRTPVTTIDHSGKTIRIDTPRGTVEARAVVLTVSTGVLAAEGIRFTPALPEKLEAAALLPPGLADKLFLFVDSAAGDLEKDSRVFGATDTARTASFHIRPFGRPLVECYFGGVMARELEGQGEAAFADFAIGQLVELYGADFRRRLTVGPMHAWGTDPYAFGSYSHARPGHHDKRAVLARPVDDRLFFAGEACSENDFSTAHGAYRTGLAAAEKAIDALTASGVGVRRERPGGGSSG
ncbi:monoamine oxidase [Faunimonas pinastri]|uniref:Tryptophan 2-monooxygenase n=1 Tax=Faunimonas pinastri TaxID=1855383 RepID=A0A1H9ANP7_9HYPH|nr:NAD(P)/FAD-dependent oxidoreductase [Faunimonas pinastri]SEP78087.1 monoamine oxidase [Faunimonas pinastri]